ncbi:MAG TPA: glycosyltransferase family 4 protein [Candidatus Syntrophosphaera sp.]|nr:glycosyltransferase family 4 protein [Candidatus Syntrophosphaera sp.]
MKILYISQYFHPEIGATTNRAAAIALAMKDAGHQVTMLCEMPNHPQGVIFPGYRGKFIAQDDYQGIPVVHLPVKASPKKNFLTRVLMYVSFSVSAMLYLALRRPSYDLLYISSPPLFVALCGLLSKLIFPRRRVVFEVRDLWPDSAIDLGELTNKTLIRVSQALERSIYYKSDLVVGVTQYIRTVLLAKGVPDKKIVVNRNGVDAVIVDAYSGPKQKKGEEPFTAIFSGNMGLAYDLEPVLHCADLMRDELVRFLLIGEGPGKKGLQLLSRQLKLNNVVFRDPVPMADLSPILAEADCGILCLKDLPVLNGALPVKIFDYMAFALPIVAGIKGEAADLIIEAQAGIICSPGDSSGLAAAICRLMSDPEKAVELGQQGRKYVLERFQRKLLASGLVAELSSRFEKPARQD